MGAEVIIPLMLTAAASGAQMYNTRRTEQKQDNQLAQSIRSRSREQQKADALVKGEVDKIAGSRSDDERAKSLDGYMQQLRTNRKGIEGGLTPNVGGDTFRADAASAANEVQGGAQDRAGLMARIDAPTMQRQGEAFSQSRLGSDLDLEGRASRGQAYIDELRLRGIRRNPWIDAAAQMGSAAAGGYSGGFGGGGKSATGGTALDGFGSLGLGGDPFAVLRKPNPNQWGVFSPRPGGG